MNEEEKTVTISAAEREILGKLENRLVHITKRNPLLYTGRLRQETMLDVVKNLADPEIIRDFVIRRAGGSLTLHATPASAREIYDLTKKIIRTDKKVTAETGNRELYLAYPFVQGKLGGNLGELPIKAPLLLFPVRLEAVAGKVSLRCDFDREILYNTTLILAHNKAAGVNPVLPENEMINDDMSVVWQTAKDFYAHYGIDFAGELGAAEVFWENKVQEFPLYPEGSLEVKNYVTLGIYSTYATSIYADFKKLLAAGDIGEHVHRLLTGLSNNEMISITGEPDETKENKTLEEQIDYIAPLDSAQEKVLASIQRGQKEIVVYGPPGTGKSQTITNIIAQAVLAGKNVLVVSEKKTALDVIDARLGPAVSPFALLIDDVEDKREFYERLSRFLEAATGSGGGEHGLLEQINEKKDAINRDLSRLEKLAAAFYGENKYATCMATIYNACHWTDLADPQEREIFNWVTGTLRERSPALWQLTFGAWQKMQVNWEKQNDDTAKMSQYLEVMSSELGPALSCLRTDLRESEQYRLQAELQEICRRQEKLPTANLWTRLREWLAISQKLHALKRQYFLTDSQSVYRSLAKQTERLRDFMSGYQEWRATKFVFENLKPGEQEFLLASRQLQTARGYTWPQAVEKLFQVRAREMIDEFEGENQDVLKETGHFRQIQKQLAATISERSQLTAQFLHSKLLAETAHLDQNGRRGKIVAGVNAKRRQSIPNFLKRYRSEIFDSVRVWLVTPEVVSDLFPFQPGLFDVLVFDEASQLFLEKAIPAIYRARQVIVAGDDKQLPPNEIGLGRVGEEEDQTELQETAEVRDVLDFTSLLDVVKRNYFPTHLQYHYRCRSADLIDFSNYAFYRGQLVVVSHPQAAGARAIERRKIADGCWLGRTNLPEAKAVVSLLKEILRGEHGSIGVITFNAPQMDLIEDLIDQEKQADPDFRARLNVAENVLENGIVNAGFFVKNIENVQGDERDIIIFCVGYAKDETGRVRASFGSLSREGGENRLNVAISRAKKKIYVVTSIEPEDLHLSAHSKRGPKLLREYLAYVRSVDQGNENERRRILQDLLNAKPQTHAAVMTESILEEQVYQALLQAGFTNMTTQQPVGGFWIDIVINDEMGRPLLGIECDGVSYHGSDAAREYDYHRQKYLEGRGWQITRIWSPDWWRDQTGEITKIKALVKSIKEQL